MDYSYTHYFELLKKGDFDEALKFRSSDVPEYLYKFVSLTDDTTLNNKKIETLANNRIWAAPADMQNDPFEFRGICVDRDKFKSYQYTDEVINNFENLFTLIKNSFCLASFTLQMASNLPMWAHYANKHKGFCVKYHVDRKECFRRVFYEPERLKIASILTQFLNLADEIEKQKQYIPQIQFYSMLMQEIYFIKHESWKCENEYRLIYPNDKHKQDEGFEVDNKDIGLQTSIIYAGYNCYDIYNKQLEEIALKYGAKFYKATLSRTNYAVFEN